MEVIYVSQRVLISEYRGGQEGQNYNPWRDVSGGNVFIHLSILCFLETRFGGLC